jgi:hypothetical protein
MCLCSMCLKDPFRFATSHDELIFRLILIGKFLISAFSLVIHALSTANRQVYATDGDDTLGGSDLDLCLYNILKRKVSMISCISRYGFVIKCYFH